MTDHIIRPATIRDAAAAVAVLPASITELCAADHHGDPATLARWLNNRTTAHFEAWLANPDTHLVVAEQESELIGVGSVNRSGDVQLCYVRPGRQRVGIGGAILRALEARAQHWALSELRLTSSLGARDFYERHGYVSTGPARSGFGVRVDYPYAKRLSSSG